MNKTERHEQILALLKEKWESSLATIRDTFVVSRTTLWRDLETLIQREKIVEIRKWIYTPTLDPLMYINTPFFERKAAVYNFDFLRSYWPKNRFLHTEHIHMLDEATQSITLDTTYLEKNQRIIENILIDISYASSWLEWNTYSYLDTEVLIKYNESAKWKSKEETTMILNHKKTINYILHHKNDIPYTDKTIQEIHTLLATWLLQQQYVWIIRNSPVQIGWSTYTPLDNAHQLQQELELFWIKFKEIQNPFEQSLFMLVFLSYFQLFMDVNKRTSRLSCNLPLVKHALPLISFLQAEKRPYINAILAIYELNDPSLMAELYVQNYLLNMHRYTPTA